MINVTARVKDDAVARALEVGSRRQVESRNKGALHMVWPQQIREDLGRACHDHFGQVQRCFAWSSKSMRLRRSPSWRLASEG